MKKTCTYTLTLDEEAVRGLHKLLSYVILGRDNGLNDLQRMLGEELGDPAPDSVDFEVFEPAETAESGLSYTESIGHYDDVIIRIK